MKRRASRSDVFGTALLTLVATSHAAYAASISATPNPCIAAAGGQTCTTQLAWSGGPANTEVWTTIVETGETAQVDAGPQGSQSIPWIVLGYNYRFELRDGSNGAVLTSAQVTGQAAPAISLAASPNPCVAASGSPTCTTSIVWSNAPSSAQLWTTILETGQTAQTSAGASGNVSIPWIVVGFTYQFQVRDAQGGVLATRVVTGQAAGNAPPAVSLSASPGAGLVAPVNVTLVANASDPDGNVARVQFFNGSVPLGEDHSAPFSLTWPITAAGTYQVRAVAFDNLGASTSSSVLTLNVAAPTGLGFSLPADYADFAPYRTSMQGFDPGATSPSWRSEVSGPNIDVYWGGDREAHGLRPNCRFTWLWGYGAANDPYNVDTSKALLTVYHPSGAVTSDVSRECGDTRVKGPMAGQPYALRVVDGVPYRLQVWGSIHGNSQAPHHRKRYYWEATYSFNPQSHNPCWTGPYPSRPVVIQQEAWWDRFFDGQQWHAGTWARGAKGDIGIDGEPNGNNVQYATHWEIGYKAGYSWNLRWLQLPYPASCLQRN